jgi:hypothetical protein
MFSFLKHNKPNHIEGNKQIGNKHYGESKSIQVWYSHQCQLGGPYRHDYGCSLHNFLPPNNCIPMTPSMVHKNMDNWFQALNQPLGGV